MDLSNINLTIVERVNLLIKHLFKKFEKNLVDSGEAICSRYQEISLHLQQSVTTPKEAVDMDMYKY